MEKFVSSVLCSFRCLCFSWIITLCRLVVATKLGSLVNFPRKLSVFYIVYKKNTELSQKVLQRLKLCRPAYSLWVLNNSVKTLTQLFVCQYATTPTLRSPRVQLPVGRFITTPSFVDKRMGFLVISADLHNTLCVIALFVIIFLFAFWTSKRIRELWQHYTVVSTRQRNVLLLESNVLAELRDVLHTIHDNIEMNPRQIRRLLRSALDENVVKEVTQSECDVHIDARFLVCYTLYSLDLSQIRTLHSIKCPCVFSTLKTDTG